MTKEVLPDYAHALKLAKQLLLLPFTLLQVIFSKDKTWKELLKPLKTLWDYFWDAKFTAILIIINCIVFMFLTVYMAQMSGGQQAEFAIRYLMDGPSTLLGINVFAFIANWFVHLSFTHLFANMVGLFVLGRVVEKNFGYGKYALIYFGSAIVSGLVDDLVHIARPDYFANGASGAIAGLASAAILVEPFYLVFVFLIPIPVILMGWTQLYTDITGVLNPVDTGVANFAHLGGFFAIGILAFFMSKAEKSKLWKGLIINIVTLAVLGLAWFVIGR